MHYKYNILTGSQVRKIIENPFSPCEMWVSIDGRDWVWREVLHVVEPNDRCLYVTHDRGTSYRIAAIYRTLEFDTCPSKFGWHNPKNLTPEAVLARAKAMFGVDVDVNKIRLLCRDEIGERECHWWGSHANESFTTTVPYGEIQEPDKYTFPECAPYGYSNLTGTKIAAPEGYRLLPEGRDILFISENEHAIIYSKITGKYTLSGPSRIVVDVKSFNAVFMKEDSKLTKQDYFGGPSVPLSLEIGETEGFPLRDYLIGQCLVGYAESCDPKDNKQQIAKNIVEMVDVIIKERSK